MRKLIWIFGILLTWPAHAGTTVCHEFGGNHYCDGPNGYRSEEHTFGGNTYGHDNHGRSWTSHQFGGNTYIEEHKEPQR